MNSVVIIKDESSWPSDIITHLNNHIGTLTYQAKNHSHEERVSRGREYDKAIIALEEILSNYFLIGYHSTRLTEKEINNIVKNGMSLPDAGMLTSRINRLKEDRLISPEIANRLITENETDSTSRKGQLWFCFFPPHIAGESGIERLFRSWGGEALYNSHENDLETGPVLNKIGMPCIIKAKISINTLKGSFLPYKILGTYLKNRDIKSNDNSDYEHYTSAAILPENILEIIKFPDPEFLNLTKCSSWRKKLI